MAFAGLRGTGDWAVDERPKNFRNMILWRQPNGSAPLTALMAKMKTETTDDPEFNWWEEENTITRVQISAAILGTTDTTTTLLAGGLALVPGDVLLVEKTETTAYNNELVVVSSVSTDTGIVIKRGQAGSSAAAIAASSYLTKIGNAYAEGTDSPDVTSRNPTKIFNYTQIFKTAYEMTNTAKVTRTRTGDPLKNDKKRRMFDHSTALELAWLFGQKHETTGANGKPLRYTGGLRQYITTNVSVFTTTPTEDSFLNAIYPVFDFQADGVAGTERIVMAGNGFLNSLNKLAARATNARINHTETVKYYGMELMKWVLPQGTLYVKTHPLMNVHARYNNSAFVINPSSIIYRPMTGRDTKPQDNIQAPDADTHKGQWLTEAGIEVQHEKTMAYLGNFVV
jgi:hypothetical protein